MKAAKRTKGSARKAPSKKREQKSAPLYDRLLAVAEKAVAKGGLSALKARDLAAEADCALGAIYTAFADLDELALRVNERTLLRLEAALNDALVAADPKQALHLLARAYLDFARREEPSWRALFEHRLPPGASVPKWYVEARERLFGRLEAPLAELLSGVDAAKRALLARTLFSAVHGVVLLGLEEKLAETPPEILDAQLEKFIDLIIAGLQAA